MDGFHDNIMFSLNMRDEDSNVVFNTCIRYNKHSVRIVREVLVDILEIVKMNSSYFGIFAFYYITGKTIIKDIY